MITIFRGKREILATEPSQVVGGKTTFTFKMPTTAQGMMKQLTEWAKSLSKKERAEVRQSYRDSLE